MEGVLRILSIQAHTLLVQLKTFWAYIQSRAQKLKKFMSIEILCQCTLNCVEKNLRTQNSF